MNHKLEGYTNIPLDKPTNSIFGLFRLENVSCISIIYKNLKIDREFSKI